MTREEAVNELNDRIKAAEYVNSDYIDCVSVNAVKMAISALSVPDTNVGDMISRQAAIDAIFSEPLYKSGMKKRDVDVVVPAIYEKIKSLPSAQSTLYGYSIEHLALIARVMQKENVTPEKAIECFKDIGRIVQMIVDEQQEIIRRAMEKWTI